MEKNNNPRAFLNNNKEELISTAVKILDKLSITESEDTKDVILLICSIIDTMPKVKYKLFISKNNIYNLEIILKGEKGKRLEDAKRIAFNGHIDTFPVGEENKWSTKFRGEVKDNRLYGRGAADMKGAIAAYIFTLKYLYENIEQWDGEVQIIIVGDEQNGGLYGTQYLLDETDILLPDAVINGDMGSPYILRFGEKGLLWLEFVSKKQGGHSAFINKHGSANKEIIDFLRELEAKIQEHSWELIDVIEEYIEQSKLVIDAHQEKGEAEILKDLSFNIGFIQGGTNINLLSQEATALVDIRIPCGCSLDEIVKIVNDTVAKYPTVTYKVLDKVEPNWTDPKSEIANIVKEKAKITLGQEVTSTIRVGASDSIYYRRKDIPAVNLGLTAYNAGAPDEYVLIDELESLTEIFILSALEYLN